MGFVYLLSFAYLFWCVEFWFLFWVLGFWVFGLGFALGLFAVSCFRVVWLILIVVCAWGWWLNFGFVCWYSMDWLSLMGVWLRPVLWFVLVGIVIVLCVGVLGLRILGLLFCISLGRGLFLIGLVV